MGKEKKKSLVGWIKEGFINMPPKTSFTKHFYRHLILYNNPVNYYWHIKFKKVRITIEELPQKGGRK